MDLQMIALDEQVAVHESRPVDGLIASFFDRTFTVFNLFVDDPQQCLQRSEAVFRALDEQFSATEADYYAKLVEHVRALPRPNPCVPGVSRDSILCWLLKDSEAMRYDEIGLAMCMDRDEVASRIADVRMALLG